MANLTETSAFEAAIYQLETSDPVLGGPGGISNLQPQQLANRTRFLKDRVDLLEAAATGLATQAYVQAELEKLDHKNSVRAATTANISTTGLLTIDGIVLAPGDRVLVKNQTAGAQNGIYVASASAWTRAVDADANDELTPGLVVAVESGTTQADTRWQLTTDGAIVIGTTSLVFANITNGLAPLASPALTGNPTAPTPAQFDNDQSLATTEFVQRANGNYSAVSIEAANRTMTAADVGKYIFCNANNIDLTLPNPASIPLGSVITVVQASTSSGARVLAPAGVTLNGVMDGSTVTGGNMPLTNRALYEFVVVSSTAYQATSYGGANVLAASGYQRLPSGLILQWGSTGSIASNGSSGTITFPVAFPNAAAYVNFIGTGPVTAGANTNPTLATKTAANFSFVNAYLSASSFNWFAIGY